MAFLDQHIAMGCFFDILGMIYGRRLFAAFQGKVADSDIVLTGMDA